MSDTSVHERLSTMDKRLSRLERHPRQSGNPLARIGDFFYRLNRHELVRLLGWFIAISSALSLASHWLAYTEFNVFLGAMVVVGVWLAFQHSDLGGVGESTRQLLQEGRAGARHRAHGVHHAPRVRKQAIRGASEERLISITAHSALALGIMALGVASAWLLSSQVANPVWQLFTLLAVLMAVLSFAISRRLEGLTGITVAASYVLLAFSQEPVYALACLMLLTVGLLYYAWTHAKWTLLLTLVLGSYLALGMWLWQYLLQSGASIAYVAWPNFDQGILAAGGWLAVLFLAPFVLRRRQAAEREIARAILGCNVALFLGLLLSAQYFANVAAVPALLEIFIATLLAFGYLGWTVHNRLSYTKHYSLLAVGVTVILVMSRLDAVLLTLFCFMLSIGLLTVGFALESYTLRSVGLGSLALTVLYYLSYVLPVAATPEVPVWLHDRFWLGIVLTIFLMVLVSWFKGMRLTGSERRQQPVIIGSLSLAALAIPLAVAFIGFEPPAQTLLLIGISLIGLAYALTQRASLLGAVSLGVALSALVKLFLVDSLLYPPTWQGAFLAGFGILLILLAFVVQQRRKELAALF